MAENEELLIKIGAEISGLKAELSKAASTTESAMKEMTKSVDSFSKKGSSSADLFSSSMATMAGFIGGQVVLGALQAATDAVLGFAKVMVVDGVKGAAEEEKAINRLNFALGQSGVNVQSASAAIQELASELERTAGVEDVTTIRTATLIQSLGQLTEKGLKQATSATIDMAAALGIDAETAARAIGKAAQGSTEALARYGITIENTGNKSRDFANAIDQINKRFGGAAVNQVNTFEGALNLLSVNFGNIGEAVGGAIVSNQAFMNVLQSVSGIMAEVAGWIKNNQDVIGEWIDVGINAAISSMIAFVETTGAIIDGIKLIVQYIDLAIDSFTNLGAVVSKIMDGDIKGAFSQAAEPIKEFGNDVVEVLENPTFQSFSNTLKDIGNSAADGFGKSRDATNEQAGAFDKLSETQQRFISITKAQEEAQTSFVNSLIQSGATIEGRYQSDVDALEAKYEMETSLAEDDFVKKRELELAYLDERDALLTERQANEMAALEQLRIQKSLSDSQYALAKDQLEKKQTSEQQKELAKRQNLEFQYNQQRMQNLQSTLNFISSLSSAKSKELAAIGKAAAIADATINTYKAANVALGSAPPPFNFGLAAAVVAAGIVNVAKISGTQLASGIDSVPGIGNADNFPAILAPGERVVPKDTNQDLKDFLANFNPQSAQQNVRVEISLNDNIMDMIEARLVERNRLVTSISR